MTDAEIEARLEALESISKATVTMIDNLVANLDAVAELLVETVRAVEARR